MEIHEVAGNLLAEKTCKNCNFSQNPLDKNLPICNLSNKEINVFFTCSDWRERVDLQEGQIWSDGKGVHIYSKGSWEKAPTIRISSRTGSCSK